MKLLKEWFIQAPWGKIALISWGNPDGEPVLLVHGRQDSVATFLPLLELLPDTYHYVGLDLPGHGKSDVFPIGITVTRFLFVVAFDVVIKHLKYTNFTCLAHSMGAEVGLFYNAIYPGHIKKIILLDPRPALQRLMIGDQSTFYAYYDNYYNNYSKYNKDDRVYSKSKALNSVMRARGMSESQAEIILSRNLNKIGEDQYRLAWDRRTRMMPPANNPLEYYYKLFSKSSPPTLFICASQGVDLSPYAKVNAEKLVSDLEGNLKNFTVLRVDGGHDVHFTNPERISGHVRLFLEKKCGNAKCKL